MGGSYKWPTVEETREFRLKVRALIHKIIDRIPLELPVGWNSPWVEIFLSKFVIFIILLEFLCWKKVGAFHGFRTRANSLRDIDGAS